jgi:hypothetical protein
MSSSKSSQSTAQNYTDNRAVLGEASTYANNGASVSTTNYVLDGGAIESSMKLGEAAIGANTGTTKLALEFGGRVLDAGAKATDRALDNLQATQKLTADAYQEAKGRGALTDSMLIATVAGALLVAGLAVRANA